MRIVFLGTSAFAVPTLRALIEAKHEIVAVVTQPDRPAGRGLALRAPPVKAAARDLNLSIDQPARIRDESVITHLDELAPDLLVVAAYGQILPPRLLDIPRLAPVNLHASLLPRHRGPAPIAWAILEGDTETGVTIMRMDEGVDTGPVYAQRGAPIFPDDTVQSLEDRLAQVGAHLMVETLPRIQEGLQPVPQGQAAASYAPRLTTRDGQLDLQTMSAAEIDRRVRALTPEPGVWIQIGGRVVKLLRGHVARAPGERGGMPILTADQTYIVEVVQPPGKRPMPAEAFARGLR